ncbi:sigma-70 family RNA polymerase sigma factor [Thermoproteota archaeon]
MSYKPLVEYICKKLTYDKNDYDDILQVGVIGLLRALDRFQPEKEVDFATFATPNIIGEIRHYFRDKRNLIKVPRKLQERYSAIKRYIRHLQKEGLSPTISEIADNLGITEEQVLEAMESSHTTTVISLDAPIANTKDSSEEFNSSLLETLGTSSEEGHHLTKLTLRYAIKQLTKREKKIIVLRFYAGLSQFEMSEKLGLSQMHISRLITKALSHLRVILEKHAYSRD